MNPCESLKEFWIGKFHAKGESIIPFFVNCSLPRQLWLNEYKKLPPIETMPEKEKKEMKQYVISMFPNKTIEQKLECCKIIYCVGSLL